MGKGFFDQRQEVGGNLVPEMNGICLLPGLGCKGGSRKPVISGVIAYISLKMAENQCVRGIITLYLQGFFYLW